jgi:hypothetical protein
VGGVLRVTVWVVNCTLLFRTSKAGAHEHLLERHTVCEEMVLEDLCLWMLRSGVLEEEDLLTRHPPLGDKIHGVVSLRRKEYSRVFHWLCSAVLGITPGSLSSKSVRGGYAASAYLDRMSPPEINQGGGWSYSSRTPIGYYIPSSIRAAEPQAMVPSDLHLGGWARTVGPTGVGGLTVAWTLQLAGERDAARALIKSSLQAP